MKVWFSSACTNMGQQTHTNMRFFWLTIHLLSLISCICGAIIA